MDDEKAKKKPGSNKKEKKQQSTLDELGNQVEKFAIKTAESIKRVIDKTRSSRNTVLSIRIDDESDKKMNMLVDAGLFKSRSESGAFLIQEGLKSQSMLFSKITSKLEKIDKIKEELKNIVSEEFQEEEKKTTTKKTTK